MQARKVIDFNQRPWAQRREFQRYLGVYVQDEVSGLYFASETPAKNIAIISAAFAETPNSLRQLAQASGVTVSTQTPQFQLITRTAIDSSSNFYGELSPNLVSPHINMSDASLTKEYVSPHLIHELAHLWWRHQDSRNRQLYLEYLLSCSDSGTIEITPYVQKYFEDCVDNVAKRENQRDVYHWVEESFCDTVAVLSVPTHPDYDHKTTVDLKDRHSQIEQICKLTLI